MAEPLTHDINKMKGSERPLVSLVMGPKWVRLLCVGVCVCKTPFITEAFRQRAGRKLNGQSTFSESRMNKKIVDANRQTYFLLF